MRPEEGLAPAEGRSEASVAFSSFALANTGILRAQTSLKLEDYALSAVPWQFDLRRGVLAGPFSEGEIAFFQRYRGCLASLALQVQRPDQKEPRKIYCRCQLAALGPMRGREGLGLLVLDWKPLHPELGGILEGQLGLLKRLEAAGEALRDRRVAVDPASARRLGYNNFAALSLGGAQHKLALFSIGTRALEFLMPLSSPDLPPGAEGVFTLYFLKYRFSVRGQVESSGRLASGVQRVRASIGFSPELVHILEEYFAGRSP